MSKVGLSGREVVKWSGGRGAARSTEKQEGTEKSRGHRVARSVTRGQEGDEWPRECVQDDAEWL